MGVPFTCTALVPSRPGSEGERLGGSDLLVQGLRCGAGHEPKREDKLTGYPGAGFRCEQCCRSERGGSKPGCRGRVHAKRYMVVQRLSNTVLGGRGEIGRAS